MERVESAKQFGNLVKEFKRNNKPVQSNCFFLPAEVESMVRRGVLSFVQSEEGLYFHVKETGCYRLYYYLRSDSLPTVQKHECSTILDYVFRGEEEKELSKAGSEKWEEMGYRPYKRYRRMECLRSNFIPASDLAEKMEKYPVVPMSLEDYPTIVRLWEESLDGYSTPLPDETEFAEECAEGNVRGIRLADGSAGAVEIYVRRGRTGFFQHLAVDPQFRGLGMGRTLHSAAIKAAFSGEDVDKVNLWVDEKNVRAIDIYQKAGFVFDGLISRQFILEEEKTQGDCR